MRPIHPALAAAAVLALGGCRQKDAQGAIPRDRFVLANIAVRAVPDTAAKGDSLRHAALKKYGVTEAQLRRFVDVHAGKAEFMAGVWKEIADSVQKRYDRTVPKDVPHPPSSEPPQPQPIPDGTGLPAPGAVPPPLPPPSAVPGRPVPGRPRGLPRGARRPDIRPPNERRAEPPPVQPPPPRTAPPRDMVKRLPPPNARDVNGTVVRPPGDTLAKP